VENIVSMFKADKTCYEVTGYILRDERFMVRMGVAVLFEELKEVRPEDVSGEKIRHPLLSNRF